MIHDADYPAAEKAEPASPYIEARDRLYRDITLVEGIVRDLGVTLAPALAEQIPQMVDATIDTSHVISSARLVQDVSEAANRVEEIAHVLTDIQRRLVL